LGRIHCYGVSIGIFELGPRHATGIRPGKGPTTRGAGSGMKGGSPSRP
jgi:hypothetical protein